jgi:hypothetical protein
VYLKLVRIISFNVYNLIITSFFTQDFLEANQAVSFFVKRKILRDAISVQSLTLENGQTREKLVIKRATAFYGPVMILRYPMGINEEEWIEEMSKFPNMDANRMIAFDE